MLAVDLRVARIPSSITTSAFYSPATKQPRNLSIPRSLLAAWETEMVPGAPTSTGTQALRNLTQEHATNMVLIGEAWE